MIRKRAYHVLMLLILNLLSTNLNHATVKARSTQISGSVVQPMSSENPNSQGAHTAGTGETQDSKVSWWIQSIFGGFVSGFVILFGFLLKEYAEKRKERSKQREFLQSACAELRHLLACLLLDYRKTKANMDGLSGTDFKWDIKAYKEFRLDKVTDPSQQHAPMPASDIDELSDEELKASAAIVNAKVKKPSGVFIRFPQLDLSFIENNLRMVGSLTSDTQQLLFRILGRIRAINGFIKELDQEYERSFHFANDDKLSPRIQQNKGLYYKHIASCSYEASNEIMKFLRVNQPANPAKA